MLACRPAAMGARSAGGGRARPAPAVRAGGRGGSGRPASGRGGPCRCAGVRPRAPRSGGGRPGAALPPVRGPRPPRWPTGGRVRRRGSRRSRARGVRRGSGRCARRPVRRRRVRGGETDSAPITSPWTISGTWMRERSAWSWIGRVKAPGKWKRGSAVASSVRMWSTSPIRSERIGLCATGACGALPQAVSIPAS